MITHFDATLTLLGVIIGILSTLTGVIWKARGWVDRLNQTDAELGRAITALTETMREQHADNQRRLLALEAQGRQR